MKQLVEYNTAHRGALGTLREELGQAEPRPGQSGDAPLLGDAARVQSARAYAMED